MWEEVGKLTLAEGGPTSSQGLSDFTELEEVVVRWEEGLREGGAKAGRLL